MVWECFRQVLSYSVHKFSNWGICRHRRRAKPFCCTHSTGRGCAPHHWPCDVCPWEKGALQVKEEPTAAVSHPWCTAGNASREFN